MRSIFAIAMRCVFVARTKGRFSKQTNCAQERKCWRWWRVHVAFLTFEDFMPDCWRDRSSTLCNLGARTADVDDSVLH